MNILGLANFNDFTVCSGCHVFVIVSPVVSKETLKYWKLKTHLLKLTCLGQGRDNWGPRGSCSN